MYTILLVIEDNFTMGYISSILHTSGYHVFPAHNEYETNDLLGNSELHFDLIISDVHAQKSAGGPMSSTGFELAHNTHLLPKYKKTPVVFLTGKDDINHLTSEEDSALHEADEVVLRPVDPETLLQKVESLIRHGHHVPENEHHLFRLAKLHDSIHIISISAEGIKFILPFEPKNGSRLKLESNLFEGIEINPPLIEITGVLKDPLHPNRYQVEGVFSGMSETARTTLKNWLAQEKRLHPPLKGQTRQSAETNAKSIH